MSIIKEYEAEIDYVILKVKSKNKLFDVLIDIEDIDKVIGNSIALTYRGAGFYSALIFDKKTKEKRPLGRHILDIPNGEGYGTNMKHVDHINHNPLDNRKINLRYVSAKTNINNKLPYCKREGVYSSPTFIYA